MARSANQKLKLLFLRDFFLQQTDEDHPATMKDIISYLTSCDIPAERKTVAEDIRLLSDYGLDIIHIDKGSYHAYYAASRTFELPELKLIVDGIQSSRFITHRKSMELIKKIETLTSVHEARQLNRQVYVSNRVKSMNETIYYSVDALHSAISECRKIRFKYFDFGVDKKPHYKRDGAFYTVSPYALSWSDEKYYLVAYDSDDAIIKHFRVDKMTDITVTDEPRDGREAFEKLDMALYTQKIYGMFTGDPVTVKLRFPNSLVSVALDRFGTDVFLIPDGDDHFTVSVEVVPSPQFFGWICGFGGAVTVTAPPSVLDQMREHVRAIKDSLEPV